MLLVGYGIKYKSKNTKDGYDLIDGQKHKEIGIKPSPRGKKSTPLLELLHSDWIGGTGVQV